MKIAIITGVTGQDGSYLAEFLLEKNYTVIGLTRRTSLPNTGRISHLLGHPRFSMDEFDITDIGSIIRVFQKLPEYERLEVYNLAAQSHVNTSFYQPECSANVDAIGPLKILEAIRLCKLVNCRFYQAATSEMFGRVQEIPQSEATPFYPRSPYGVAKMYSFWIVKNYRESYDMYACSGILFNHESERRGHEFVTRKITLAVAQCVRDSAAVLKLGNLDSKRDWGHARDYVKGMWLMLQQDVADDFVMATGETHTVREFIERSFRVAGKEIEWRGSGVDEVGVDRQTGRILVCVDPQLYRPAEVDLLIGNPARARTVLGWVPEMTFGALVDTMTRFDLGTSRV